jgi:hypothetical protein
MTLRVFWLLGAHPPVEDERLLHVHQRVAVAAADLAVLAGAF